MNNSIQILFYLVIASIMLPLNIFSQGRPTDSTTIISETEFNPFLKDAFKIKDNPNINDTNKIIPDYETNSQQIIYENLDGYAVSNGVSFDMDVNFSIPLNIKIGGTFMDVYQMNRNEAGQLEREEQLLTENVSGTYSVSYTFSKSSIKIDYSGNLYGPMKLPLVENDKRPPYSDWYSIQNIQVTKTFKKGWEIYGGLKNILNFTPPVYSILRANDPFDKNVNDPVKNPNNYSFDPTYVYAANQGIRGFFGVRYTLK